MNKQAVDHLVDRPVAADHHDLAETVVDRLNGQFDRMVLAFGERILRHDVVIAQ